tara:strand:- start:4346 stop:4936 length:591 start_codon:yes stop_codon:yes gene_type:complete
MREFLIRARKAPVDPDRFLRNVGENSHVEYLAQVMQHGLLVSKGHRADTRLTLVLENSADFSRAITIDGGNLGSLAGWDEAALVEFIAHALGRGKRLGKGQEVSFIDGVTISATSFEYLIRNHERVLAVLDPKGDDIRTEPALDDVVFVMTDQIPMPRNTLKYMRRLGARPVSLGPVMLHASQCISVIHNELDRRD